MICMSQVVLFRCQIFILIVTKIRVFGTYQQLHNHQLFYQAKSNATNTIESIIHSPGTVLNYHTCDQLTYFWGVIKFWTVFWRFEKYSVVIDLKTMFTPEQIARLQTFKCKMRIFTYLQFSLFIRTEGLTWYTTLFKTYYFCNVSRRTYFQKFTVTNVSSLHSSFYNLICK